MGRKREGRCCAPFVSEQFSCFLSPIATAHEQHTPGRGPGSVAYPLLPQGVGLLPAASCECYTRPPPTDEETGLRMMSSLGWKHRQRTQSGPVAVEQLHIGICICVVTSRHQYK